MKKIFAAGLAATMVVLMAACAQPSPGSPGDGTGTTAAATTAVTTAAGTTDDTDAGSTAETTTAAGDTGNTGNGDMLSEDDARQVVLNNTDDPDNAEILHIELDDDDRDGDDDPEYEGYVRDGNTVYEFEIDALTGEIEEWDVEDDYEGSDNTDSTATGDLLTEDEVKDIILAELNDPDNAEFLEFELDDDDRDGDDEPEYEGYVRDGDTVYEFEVDARTGEIEEWEVEDDAVRTTTTQDALAPDGGTGQVISEDEARQLVLDRLDDPENAEFLKFEFDADADDGGVEPDYEGKVRDGDTVYEFEIDALTGNFDEWEVDDN